MDGYTVSEAASVLGVSTERVWELLARGVLAGQPEGEAGMRVFLRPRPGPVATVDPEESRRPNGHDGEPNPFRELLTEFRNLTERYGQALLALGEARGEVASLRGRVELLEARIDLRLPPPAPTAEARSWTDAPQAQATPPPAPPETPMRPEPEAPAPAAPEPRPEEPKGRRRRGRGGRSAIAGLAEALARADDPSPTELRSRREASESGATTAGPTEAASAATIEVAEAPAAVVATEPAAPATGFADADAGIAPAEPAPADALPVAEEAMTAVDDVVVAEEPEPTAAMSEEPTTAGEHLEADVMEIVAPDEPAEVPVIAERVEVAERVEAAAPTEPEEAPPAPETVDSLEPPAAIEQPDAFVAESAQAATEPVEEAPVEVPEAIHAVAAEPSEEGSAVIAEAPEPVEETPVEVPEAIHAVEAEPPEEGSAVIAEAPEPVESVETVAMAEPTAEPAWTVDATELPGESAEAEGSFAEPTVEVAGEDVQPDYVALDHHEWETEPGAGIEVDGEPRTDMQFGDVPVSQAEVAPEAADQPAESEAQTGEGYTARLHEPDWFTDADLAAAAPQALEPLDEGGITPTAVDAPVAEETGPPALDEGEPAWGGDEPYAQPASVDVQEWTGAPSEPGVDEAPEAAPFRQPQAAAAAEPDLAPAERPAEEEQWVGADEPAEYADEMEVSTHVWRADEPSGEALAAHESPEQALPPPEEASSAATEGAAAVDADERWDDEQVAEARAMLQHANAVEWEVDDADAAAYPLSDDDEQRLHAAMSASLPDDIWVEDWGGGTFPERQDEAAPTTEAPPTNEAAPTEPADEATSAPTAGSTDTSNAPDQPSRLAMPGSRELDEALAALDALARPTTEPQPPPATTAQQQAPAPEPVPQPLSGDQIVQRLRSQMAARREDATPRGGPAADRAGAVSPEQPDWQHERRGPAARAFRRLRRIIPG